MPKDKISQYAFTPAANTDIGGINIDEGCAPSGINNAIRTLMTQIRDLQAGVSGDTVPLTAGGTGSGTAASARAALGLAIGTNVLGYVTPGTSGNVLQSDGTNWTSVASTAITLDTITGGPLALAKGGTNATTAAQARTNLNAMQNYTAGATGQVLTSTGTGWVSQAASGGQLQTEVFATPGPATWTNPGSVTQIRVTVVGGGGGGGCGPGTSQGGIGGSGGLAIADFTIPTSPVSVTIGAGGAGRTGPGVGSAGSTSSFGPYLSATGGGSGPGSPGSAGANGTGTISAPIISGAIKEATMGGKTAIGLLIGSSGRNAGVPGINPAIAYSYTITEIAGAYGSQASGSSGTGSAGGVGGAVVVEFIG